MTVPLRAMLFAGLGVTLSTACVDLNKNDVQPSTWEATLMPAPAFPGLAGQAAAVVSAAGTDLGVGLSGATPGAQHTWALRLGTCALPGQQIGEDTDYPRLAVSDSGKAAAEAILGTQLARDGSYAVVVRLSTADTTRLACGNLARR